MEPSRERAERALRGEICIFRMQKRYRAKNGEIVWGSLTATAGSHAPDQPPYILGMVENLSERRRAEENQALLASIVESSIDPIIAHALDGTIISWNSAAERQFGYSAEEALGKPVQMLPPPEKRAEIARRLKRVYRGEPTELHESVVAHKDGHRVDVLVRTFPVKNGQGDIVGVAGTLHDISHRKRTQRELDLQIARLSALRAIDNAIIGAVDLELTAAEIVGQVRAIMHVHAAALFVVNMSLRQLEFAAGAGFRTHDLRRWTIRVGEGISGKTVVTRQPILVTSFADTTDPTAAAELPSSEDFVGYGAIPLVAKGQVAGVLVVLHREPLALSADQWEFLNALAAQAAIAIDNARMFESLQRSNIELRLAYDATIEGWSHAMDLRDHDTEGHSVRVADLTLRIARELGVPAEQMVHVRRGALLHDIGKVGVPDSILLKRGPLDETEWEVMRRHPVYALEMLAPIDFLQPALDIPYYHHERWDGGGYPLGLKGEQIPLAARIFAVVDVWDALRSDRPYRSSWSRERAVEWLEKLSGAHFDPRIVEVFLKLDPA
jgi:PAS domain S-box-containing protein/putative nucleotidyltransferase with HDIG domain